MPNVTKHASTSRSTRYAIDGNTFSVGLDPSTRRPLDPVIRAFDPAYHDDILAAVKESPRHSVDLLIALLPLTGNGRLSPGFLRTMWAEFDRATRPTGIIVMIGQPQHQSPVMRLRPSGRILCFAVPTHANPSEASMLGAVIGALSQPGDNILVPFDGPTWAAANPNRCPSEPKRADEVTSDPAGTGDAKRSNAA